MPIGYVIDASIVGPLVIPDEAENLLDILPDALAEGACIVPAHWHFEVGNLALMAARRKRISAAAALANLDDLRCFAIVVDSASSDAAWLRSLALAEEQGLTLYDAAYLELASRLSLILLSADRALLEAASRVAVPTNRRV
jgi:predicted nucleic acid-binding protein